MVAYKTRIDSLNGEAIYEQKLVFENKELDIDIEDMRKNIIQQQRNQILRTKTVITAQSKHARNESAQRARKRSAQNRHATKESADTSRHAADEDDIA